MTDLCNQMLRVKRKLLNPATLLLSFALTCCTLFYREIKVDPQLIKGELENGMGYLIRTNKVPEERAYLKLVINVGSSSEEEHERGFAHINEHLSFGGTQHFPNRTMIEYYENVGVRFGEGLNAYTSFDETIYEITLPLSHEGTLEQGLLTLYDWAFATDCSDEIIERERKVIREEFRTRYSASERLFNASLPVVIPHPRYSNRAVIGTVESITEGSSQSIKEFREKWYRPELMTVVIVGEIEAEVVEEQVKSLFNVEGSSPRQEQYLQKVEIPSKPAISINTDSELARWELLLVKRVIQHRLSKESDYQKLLVNYLYNYLLTNRFNEQLLLDDGSLPFIGVNTINNRVAGEIAIKGVGASIKDGRAGEALMSLLREYRQIELFGFTTEEIERAKEQLSEWMEGRYSNRETRSSREISAQYVRAITLEGGPLFSLEQEYKLFNSILPKIKKREIDRFAKEHLPWERSVIILNVPERDSALIPQGEHLLKSLARVSDEKVSQFDYQRRVTTKKELKVEPLLKGEIISEKRVAGIDSLWKLQLSNGAVVYLKPTTYKGNQIYFGGFRYGGSSLYGLDQLLSAELATEIVTGAGVKSFDPTELRRALSGKGVQYRMAMGPISEGVVVNPLPFSTTWYSTNISLH